MKCQLNKIMSTERYEVDIIFEGLTFQDIYLLIIWRLSCRTDDQPQVDVNRQTMLNKINKGKQTMAAIDIYTINLLFDGFCQPLLSYDDPSLLTK